MSKQSPKITQDFVKSILHYDLNTGVFTWLVDYKRRKRGSIASCHEKGRYSRINMCKTYYLCHRLAFLWMTGSFPDDCVDHINHIKDDNRWVNLRSCSGQQNQGNQKIKKGGSSIFKGVSWSSRDKIWRAQIRVDSKNIYLGSFDCEKEAAKVYNAACKNHHGEFANINKL